MSHLLNRQTGQIESVEIFAPMEQYDVDCFRNQWKPILDGKIEELRKADRYTREEVTAANIEDAQWSWPEKFEGRALELQWASYSIRAGGQTQGLMFLNLLRRCQLPSQQNMHMVYVDLVATAPWNRPRLIFQPLYSGVGAVLITEAILHSLDEGFEGRIGLHSLPGAESFYGEKLKMIPLGADPKYQGLVYFEMTPERATEFLRQ